MNTTPIQLSDEPRAASLPARSLLAFDPMLLIAAVGLIVCSYITLQGAVGSAYSHRQLAYGCIGLIAMVVVAVFDYSLLRRLRYWLYGVTILLNLVVFGMPAEQGATRWIPLPFFQLQPSEFGKILLILSLSALAVERSWRLSEVRTTIRIMLLALLPALIVVAQPDLGTGMVYVVAAVAILFFAGTSWKQMTALAVVFVLGITLILGVAPALGVHPLKSYQTQRLTTFIDPPTVCTPQDSTCYQLQQSEIAIGSGEKTGRGVKGATQTKFKFIPEAQDDFIFAVVGETYGFAGAALVLSLYALLIWRTLRIITMAKNLFGSLIAGGILAMFMFQVFVNVGMTIGIMPVTGVPLPLLSYGGSSVLVTFLALGLLESIHIQARMSTHGKSRVLI